VLNRIENETRSGAAPLLTLRGVGKTFASGAAALGHLDLAVREGEFVTLLGPSGCGKSTTLRIIAGLLAPSRGSVAWGAGRGDVGFVFQEPTLAPWSSVFDNVWLPLRLRGVSRAAARREVEAALARVGLADAGSAMPRQLSGGMRMRVSIARALTTRPKVLLMDEPFGALDEITRFRLNDDLLSLRDDSGLTVLFVTHSVFESVYLSSRIVIMTNRPGRVFGEIEVADAARGEVFRTSAAYAETCGRVSAMLAAAMTGSLAA
jgi:NitT/TauT family transport system ATP-binding protein